MSRLAGIDAILANTEDDTETKGTGGPGFPSDGDHDATITRVQTTESPKHGMVQLEVTYTIDDGTSIRQWLELERAVDMSEGYQRFLRSQLDKLGKPKADSIEEFESDAYLSRTFTGKRVRVEVKTSDFGTQATALGLLKDQTPVEVVPADTSETTAPVAEDDIPF